MKPDKEIEACRRAFSERRADAPERAGNLMKRLLAQSAAAKGSTSRKSALQVRKVTDRISLLQRVIDLGLKHLQETGEEGPTAELLAQIRKGRKGDPILRLYAHDKLTDQDVRSAREIAGIFEQVTRRMVAKTMHLPTKSDGDDTPENRRRTAQEAAEWTALLHSFVYLPWADHHRGDMPLILAMCVDGESLNQIAARHRIRKATALDRLRAALSSYARFRRDYMRHGPDANSRQPAPGS